MSEKKKKITIKIVDKPFSIDVDKFNKESEKILKEVVIPQVKKAKNNNE